jgi:antitoxin MazE
MIAYTRQWGNSLALRIPAALAHELGLRPDVPVELSVEDNVLCVKPVREPFPTLDELLAKVTPENRHAEVDWGPAAGHEVW